MKNLDAAQSALRGGSDSIAWQNLQTLEKIKWCPVANALKTDGSQSAFEARVAEDIARHLQQGQMPKELAAYAESARAARYVEHANRIEGLAQAMASLARFPKSASVDPARFAEAREFARVLQEARDADVARNQEKKGIEPARLAEARELARAIREARDAEENVVDKDPDPNTDAGLKQNREQHQKRNSEFNAF